MAHQIKDEKQEYQYTGGFTTPSGHEFHYYDTPKNERFVIKHASGSHIEFKADGSVMIKSLKDLHMESSIVSDATESSIGGADTTTQKIDTNYTLDVTGTLNIKCKKLNVEVGETGRVYCGTDLITNSNNFINKATESISLEGKKSIYTDTAELKQRSVTTRSEIGNKENGGKGGINILNVHGNAVIRNEDETGGITIASKGYLNLVAGCERVDVTGKYTEKPSGEAKATYTHIIKAGKGVLDVSSNPGDGFVKYETDYKEDVGGLRDRKVKLTEDVTIGGVQTIKAALIYLN
jgi:hypothetical protein